jgi:hypothetical protein
MVSFMAGRARSVVDDLARPVFPQKDQAGRIGLIARFVVGSKFSVVGRQPN